STARTGGSSGSCAFVAQTKADHAHHTSASTSIARPNPAQVRSWYSSVETWVMAKTNTRSQNSSTGVVRCSVAIASGAAIDAGVSVHADVSEHCGGHLNDMVVDAGGRAYAGNFGFDLMAGGDPAAAALVRVDPDGTASVAAEDMLFPNGSVITPDGRTLIVG